MIIYEIPGPPIPCKRARLAGKRFYDSQANKKRDIRLLIKTMSESQQPHASAIKVVVEYHMPIPKSWSRIRRLNAVGEPHVSKPDLSNLIKFIEDALNEVLWKDDSIIYELHCRKFYAEVPCTKLLVEEYKLTEK